MSGKLITFDGLDCSFKETNSKMYLEYLLQRGEKAALYSFPRYNMEQSIFVKEYLAGNYGKKNELDTTAVSMFYMMDMFDCAQKEIIPKLKEGYTVVLDRYWYCNIFYRLGLGGAYSAIVGHNIISQIENLANQLCLPKSDIIVKLKSDPDVMLDFIHRKNSKADQHESDDKYLLTVAKVFDVIDLSKYVTDRVVDVYTTKDKQIRNKEDIFKDILDGINHE